MTTTLITYIKEGKYNTHLFKIERLNKDDKKILNVKEFHNKNWLYIKRSQIVPRSLKLVKNRTYELSDIKSRTWNNYIFKNYHLIQTLETLSMKSEPFKYESKCLFSNTG